MRQFLDIAALSRADMRAILDEAHTRKRARVGWSKGRPDTDGPLAGHVLAMIFQKASTRTRVSFEMAMRQLGGSVIVMSAADMQLGRGETVGDTARVLARMVDGVMIRANRHQDVLDFAEAFGAPVVNGLTDLSHPCQIIADLMTLEERLGDLSGKRLAWLGDGNNVCASLIEAAPLMGYAMAIAAPEGYRPRTQVMEAARAAGAVIEMAKSPAAAAAGADAVVTDTWVSMGDTDKYARMAAFPPFAVDEAMMARAKKNAVFLHCLPAHRGEEVTDAVIDGQQSAVWDEAENRIHAQKAILLWCFGLIG